MPMGAHCNLNVDGVGTVCVRHLTSKSNYTSHRIDNESAILGTEYMVWNGAMALIVHGVGPQQTHPLHQAVGVDGIDTLVEISGTDNTYLCT